MMGYATVGGKAPPLEPFLTSNAAWIFAAIGALGWLVLVRNQIDRFAPAAVQATRLLAVAALPSVLYCLRAAGWREIPPTYWEPLWIAAWTGASFFHATWRQEVGRQLSARWAMIGAGILSLGAGGWWYGQSLFYYRHYQLGYNDFGHFLQRVANTAAGRGWLMESPALPPFWDHFNPGLLLLVPAWWAIPSVHLVFVLQATSLASGGILVQRMARAMGCTPLGSLAWSVAWLAQPAVGQMNLAYTYGWHPVSLALPLSMLAVLLLLKGHRWWAMVASVLAMTMQEDIIVVVACFCAVAGWAAWRQDKSLAGRWLGIPVRAWIAGAILCGASFLAVYRFSGLADFQTARFVALGDTPAQILLSPILRPTAFWGQLLRPVKLAYVLSLSLPCFLPVLVRGWRIVVAAIPPLLVLLVWDHLPASSLAFQYATGLLPILWVAALWGARELTESQRGYSGRFEPESTSASIGAAAAGLVLSLYVGQLPYSRPTLLDVRARTYGAGKDWSRGPESAIGRWLDTHTAALRGSTDASVLATGRAAAHLVGIRELETIGQYFYRRDALALLDDRRGHPLRAYHWILIDRDDRLHQSPDQIDAVEREAIAEGFVVADRLETLVLYRRTDRRD